MKSQLWLFYFLFYSVLSLAENQVSTVTIGLLPGANPVATQEQSRVLAEKLQNKLKKQVKIFIPQNQNGLIEAINKKKVDFALFSSLTYVMAEKQAAIKVLLKKTWEGPYYYSALVVNKKSKIKTYKDLKNKQILFVDKNSTSGYLYPQVYLKKHNLQDQDFKTLRFSGNHAASIADLENEKADVVAVFSDDEQGKIGAWTRFSKKPASAFRVIWTSEPIPNDPLVVRQQFYDDFPKQTLEIMYDLIEVQNESKDEVFEILGRGRLMPATSKQYDPVREMYKIFETKINL